MRLRTRLALVAAALTLLGTVLGLTLTYLGLLNLRMAGFDGENRLLANLIAEVAVLREDQTVRVPIVVGSYLTGERSTSAAHVYVDGQLIWSGGAAAAPRPLDAERLLTGVGANTVQEWRVYTTRDEDAGVVVQVGRPLLSLREVLGPFPWLGLVVAAVMTVLSGALAFWIVGLALRPLRRLSEATERLSSADDVPVIPGRDEPARLARAFAQLLQRLREERDREHRFMAYAAHELRTPLSALRAGLEAVHAGRLTVSPELVQRLYREATRLEGLAQNLLALSSAEVGDASFEQVDLERIAADAYDRYLPLALEKGLTLELDGASAPVRGDVRLLDQALGNLMSNALKATSSGGIVIRTGTADGRPVTGGHEADGDAVGGAPRGAAPPAVMAFLEVADTGSGMKPQAESKGLGLRVVRAVATAHGGSLEFADGNGTRVRLWLPRAAHDR
jgi:two-component system, OmpR family, sensor kinase